MLLLSNETSKIPTYANFIIGGLSGAVGQTVTHPLDVLKVRMQLSKTSLGEIIHDTWKGVGIRGFFVGWSAGFLRQLTYSTTRLGIYNTLFDLCRHHFAHLSYPAMVGLGMVSGIAGSLVGTPADLVLVRMIADIKLPPEKRRNYRNVITGLFDICKNEGLFGLWKGALPTMTRAAIVNGTQLGTYSKAKLTLTETGYFEDGVLLQFLSSMISGFVMCSASLPVDVAKTRIQNWNLPEKPPGIAHMVITIAKTGGIPSLWRGFLPYYSRSAPNTILTMICVEQLTRIYGELFTASE